MGMFATLLGLQLATGMTFSAGFGMSSWPAGRWTCLVRRNEEPQLYWTLIGCQVALVGAVFLFEWMFRMPKDALPLSVESLGR